jgi:hypothetical protein
VRGLCARCRGDQTFGQRTDPLVEQYRNELLAVLKEAARLADDLTAASGR